MAPESVVNATNVDSKEWQGNTEQIISQEAVVVFLWSAGKGMVDRGQNHAHLEANEKGTHHNFVLGGGMNVEEGEVYETES